MQKNIDFQLFGIGCYTLLAACCSVIDSHKKVSSELKKPNIVLILTDDLGYGDIGVFGATGYQTPHLDEMAAKGMRFNDFLVSGAICSASRAGLMTGCYHNRVGINGALMPNAEIGINPEEETIPELLKEAGYKSIAIGKWHLGHHYEFLPLQHGFDEFFGLPYSNDMWPVHYDGTPVTRENVIREKWRLNCPPLPLIDGNEVIEEILTLADQDMLTTRYTERAVDFIKRNRKNPFFLYLTHSMPHVPLAVSDKFRGKSEQGLYGDVMMEIDWSVGEIISIIEELGLTENTLVIFTSDNGPWLVFGDHAGSAGGLREGKNTSWEGGQRVPCIMKWPAVIPPGTVCSKLTSMIDLLPTFSNISGASLPKKQIDGVNILSLLKGDLRARPREVFYYYSGQNQLEAVRLNNFKLVFPHRGWTYEGFEPGKNGLKGMSNYNFQFEAGLYDLRRDPGERFNLIEFYPEVVERLQKIADEARRDLGDSLTGSPGLNRRHPGKI